MVVTERLAELRFVKHRFMMVANFFLAPKIGVVISHMTCFCIFVQRNIEWKRSKWLVDLPLIQDLLNLLTDGFP